MSIKDFSDALRSQELKAWFQRLSTDNILKMSAKDLRKKEAGKDFNSFYITPSTIADVIEKLSGAKASPESVEKVFSKLLGTTYSGKGKGLKISEPYVQGDALYYPRISMDGITKLLDSGFEEVIVEARKTNPEVRISDYFQKGHVFGIFPKKLGIVRKSLQKNTTLTDNARNILTEYLDRLEKELEAEDLATSNLKSPEYGLYAKYRKKPSNYLVELQLVEVNEAAGRQQADLAKAVRKYFDAGKVSFNTSGGIKFTEGTAEQRLKSLMEASVEKVLSSKGSPSMLDLIALAVAETIRTGKVTDKEYAVPLTQIIKSKAAKVDTREIRSNNKKKKEQVQKLKKALKNVPPFEKRILEQAVTNLVSLQNLINANLADQIKKNMGSGNATNVLNLRTGRLAESAKVERMSESRAGMITAFYSYMKNPYATFSEGGKQQYPRTRDPKLLISKSIREIAQQQVANRLRAVLV